MSDDWKAGHYPAYCHGTMTVNAVSHGCERWHCTECDKCFIREIPKQGYTAPEWTIGDNFDAHVGCTSRIRPISGTAISLPTTTAPHRCARCNATLDEASVEGHGERCFVVGDWARWWPEGESDARRYSDVCVADVLNGAPYTAVIDSHGPRWSSKDGLNGQRVVVAHGTLRRIPRPEQPALSACLGYLKHGPGGDLYYGDIKITDRPFITKQKLSAEGQETYDRLRAQYAAPPVPTLYDGLTSMECLGRWYENRARVEFGHQPKHALTAGQIAHAKVEWLTSHGRAASNLLRARIDAAREQERLRVQIDADPDDTPW